MLRVLVFVSLVVASFAADAQYRRQQPASLTSYTYVEGSFGRIDLDDTSLDVDGDGPGIAVSFSVNENFHVFGQFLTADANFGVDVDILEFGGGYHNDISRYLNVYGNVGFLKLEAAANLIGRADEDGLFGGIGVRGMVSEAVELYGGLDYIDFDNSDGQTRSTAGFHLSLTESFGVGLKAIFWDDVNIFQVNARVYFE